MSVDKLPDFDGAGCVGLGETGDRSAAELLTDKRRDRDMDNSFQKAMETVAGAIWSQLMLKGRAEVSVNGINLTTLALDVRVQDEQMASGAGRSNVSPVSGSPRPATSSVTPPPPPPSSVSSYRSGSSGSD